MIHTEFVYLITNVAKMLYILHCVYILFATYTLGICLELDENMDPGPKWYYEYRVKHLAPAHIRSGGNAHKEPKTIDIIIKNDKSNPEVVQIAEAHIYRPTNTISVAKRHRRRRTTDVSSKYNARTAIGNYYDAEIKPNTVDDYKYKPIDEDDISNYSKHKANRHVDKIHKHHSKHSKGMKHSIRLKSGHHLVDVSNKHSKMLKSSADHVTDTYTANDGKLKVGSYKKKQHKREGKHKEQRFKIEPETSLKFSAEHSPTTKLIYKHERHGANKSKFKSTDASQVRNFTEKVSPSVSLQNNNDEEGDDIYVTPHKVKDDLKIKEFTKHVYEQSLKVFETLKEKISDYRVIKDINHVIRSYQDKFGEFVSETQEQLIKTRLGTQKVILNTIDTSNRIQERCVHYLITKMDKKGILRNVATEHIMINEVKKAADLENTHICTKLNICRTTGSYSDFVVDILSMVSSSDDRKVIQVRDAATEVLKYSDLSSIMSYDAEQKFQKNLEDMETWDALTVRSYVLVTKNIIKFKNFPIKLVGAINSRVNRTVALLEMLNKFDKMIPPSTANKLEWNDLRNSFKDWRTGHRTDITDIVQAFMDHIVKEGKKMNAKDREYFQKTTEALIKSS